MKKGISIVEILIVTLMMSGVVFALFKFRGNQQSSIQGEQARWRAHLSAESVSDAISSLPPTELFTLLGTATTVSDGWTLDTASTPPAWLAGWAGKGGVQHLFVKIRLLDAAGAPVVTVPTANALVAYVREIQVTADYVFGANATQRSVKFDKSLSLVNRQPAREIVLGPENCALLVNGTFKCWRPGIPMNVSNFPSPNPLYGYGAIVLGSSGQHTCACYESGKIRCWGNNTLGGLGRDPVVLAQSGTPLDIAGSVTEPIPPNLILRSLAVGVGISCFTSRGSGSVWCWGKNFNNGFQATKMKSADGITELTGIAQVVAMKTGLALLGMDGSVSRWEAGVFTSIANLDRVEELRSSATSEHACALQADGQVACFGKNAKGQLGNNSMVDSPYTAKTVVSSLGPLNQISDIAIGSDHACALSQNSQKLYCWGSNLNKQLAQGIVSGVTLSVVAVAAQGLPTSPSKPLQGLLAFGDSSCAVFQDFDTRCWGDFNKSGVPSEIQGL